MYNDLKQLYWWSSMKRDISECVSKCLICQQVKDEHQVPSGLVEIGQSYDEFRICVTPDYEKKILFGLLTKSTHFIPVCTDYSLDRLVELYIAEIVRLHGVPVSVISDRDLRFTS
ncbi:integrase [Gossypium australe]|uniref:Integrase n=1 Tax=Gossypium australe TaxID=47621 RepID=A0A5B6VA04_9ROSI|nr:integrase [Gossypium australe]